MLFQYGFPTEKRIGINCTGLRGIQPPYYHILLVHFFGSDFPGIQELSKSWLDSNFISPHYYLTLNARGKKGKIVAGGEIYKINKEYYVERP